MLPIWISVRVPTCGPVQTLVEAAGAPTDEDIESTKGAAGNAAFAAKEMSPSRKD